MTNPPGKSSEIGIDLGPSLPMAVYHAMERWHSERIGALALYCSDGRWGEAFDEFCHRHLLIPRYDRLALPGGPAWIAAIARDPAQFQATREQLDFLVKIHELERFVLITHYGCAWYAQRLPAPEDCLDEQAKDVKAAAVILKEWYPDLRVEAYLAMRRHEWLTFHPLDVG